MNKDATGRRTGMLNLSLYSNNLATSVACNNIKARFSLVLQAHLRSAGALLSTSAVQRLMEPPLSRTSLVSW